MDSNSLVILFFQIAIMLIVAMLFGYVARMVRMPAVLGEIIGGILIGPTIVNLLLPENFQWVFKDGIVSGSQLHSFVQLGMLFFMFITGTEINLDLLRKKTKLVLLTSLFGILLPFLSGVLMLSLLPGMKGMPFTFTLTIGAALSISALPVILRILMDLKLLKTEIGIVIMASATLDDLIGWAIFTSVLPMAVSQHSEPVKMIIISLGKIALLSVTILFAVKKASGPVNRWLKKVMVWPTGLLGVLITTILLVAGLAELIGLHPFFAVFLTGITLRQHFRIKGAHLREVIYQFAMGFFAPLYFVSIGLRVDFLRNFDLFLVVIVLLVACAGKIAGAGIGALLGGMKLRDAVSVGFGMNARGAMEIILASMALDYKIINQQIFVALVIMALMTSIISGPVLKWMNKPS